jgi:hypothetical protein
MSWKDQMVSVRFGYRSEEKDMIPKMTKRLLRTSMMKSLITKLGYESLLRRLTKNAFCDQQMLLSGTKVQTIFDIGAMLVRLLLNTVGYSQNQQFTALNRSQNHLRNFVEDLKEIV